MTPAPWSVEPWTLATIAAMAAVTYALRAGGYVLFSAVKPPPIVREALAYVPGALFVSYVAPALVAGGGKEWAGAAATIVLMLLTRQVGVAILGGTAAAWGVYVAGWG